MFAFLNTAHGRVSGPRRFRVEIQNDEFQFRSLELQHRRRVSGTDWIIDNAAKVHVRPIGHEDAFLRLREDGETLRSRIVRFDRGEHAVTEILVLTMILRQIDLHPFVNWDPLWLELRRL